MSYLHDKNCAHRWDRGPCDCGAEALNANDHIHTLESDNSTLRARVVELENVYIEQGAILEAIIGALKGEEPSDFMRSFPDVEHAWWIYRLAYPTAK